MGWTQYLLAGSPPPSINIHSFNSYRSYRSFKQAVMSPWFLLDPIERWLLKQKQGKYPQQIQIVTSTLGSNPFETSWGREMHLSFYFRYLWWSWTVWSSNAPTQTHPRRPSAPQETLVTGSFDLQDVLFYGGCGFTIMRCMSFALENCDRKEGSYSFLDLLKYNFYLPFFFFGPIMTFDQFHVQVCPDQSADQWNVFLHIWCVAEDEDRPWSCSLCSNDLILYNMYTIWHHNEREESIIKM